MVTLYQKILLIIFLIAPVLAVFLTLKILQYQKWKRTQEILSKIKASNFEAFENIKFQITNYYYLKPTIGIQQSGSLYINSANLIILNSKRPFLLTITSTLPLVISKQNSDQYVIKICEWRAVLLTLKSRYNGIGFHQTELLLEPKDTPDFERLKIALTHWS